MVQDRYTQWVQAYPVPSKHHEEVNDRVMEFFGPEYHPDYSGPGAKKAPNRIYTDNAEEYARAFKDLHWLADTSTPHRSETNGIAERAVRRVREGTSAMLAQS